MKALSVEDAQAIITDVQIRNGGVNPEIWKNLPKDQLRAFRNLRTIAGSSIEHVAEDLYDADTRYIFELIQNAEDNCYFTAVNDDSEPFLHFTLYQDRLTVDSNEDGFTEADVRAICSIHRSSKRQVGGYIGHKGIGFKSVFKIAYKVCIQSGPFSFYFEYRRGDGGLAMITPFYQAPHKLPSSIRTRITLWLLNSNDFSTRARELKEIPDTLLLFLRKLRRLTIEIPTLMSRVTYECEEGTTANFTIFRKRTDKTQKKRLYYMQKQTLTDLPAHHSRQEQQGAGLILAFPLDESFKPVIEPQFVYSFLPMRNEGFNFLIQSDFITQANRQGVHLCPRNYAIREEICTLFVKAVKYFCTQDRLAYEWPQYLPSAHIYDRFWAELRDMIFEGLKKTRVLFSLGDSVLERPIDLHYLSSSHCGRRGNALLDDLYPAVYLSQSYSWARHSESLRKLGVSRLPTMSFLDRLVPCLQGKRPRYMDPALDDDWHTRIADFLVNALRNNRKGTELTGLYLPDDDQGNPIPNDLKKLLLVERQALKNSSRKELFKRLGVRHCRSDRVIKTILTRYDQHGGVTLDDSASHLRYLFHTLDKNEILDKRIFIMDKNKIPVYRVYPNFDVPQTVRHPGIPPSPRCTSYTVLISRPYQRRRSDMGAPGNSGFNERHQFANGWESYVAELTPKVIAVLEVLPVLCQNESNYPLKRTYYPSKEMQRLITNADLETEFPFFLDVPDKLETDNAEGWEFLSNFGVTLQPTIGFFFDAIQCLVDRSELDLQAEATFFFIYKELSIRFADMQDELRRNFEEAKTPICRPKTGHQYTGLLELEYCYWDGHPCLLNSLNQYPQYTNDPHVSHLFRNVLRVPDADLFAYLSGIDPNISLTEMEVVYGLIAQKITSRKGMSPLTKWKAKMACTRDCLWTETPKIGAQFGISKFYPKLEDFFRKDLKVSTPTAATYIEQLRTFLSEGPVDIIEIKSTLHKMRSVELNLSNREDLLNLGIFPVVMQGGRVKVLKPTETFVIADRIEHRSAFQGRVPFLDFSLRDIRQLHPLLEFLGLQDRYTSTAVKERTVVEVPTESPSYTETRAFQASQDISTVHMSGSNGLRIYIPRDPNDRKRCYSLHLPQALVRYFELRDREAPLIFQLVFLTSRDFIDDMLDAHGIIRSSPDVPEPQDEIQDLPISRGISESSYEFIEESEERAVSYHRAVLPTPRPFTFQYTQEVHSRPAASPVIDHQYHRVLDDSIKLARLLPFHEALRRPETTGQETVGHELAFGVRSDGQIEHNVKIGAAEELFRSTIHRKVSDHPGYRDLVPWNGAEAADIVYDDTGSAFTRALVDMGLLHGNDWLDATPTYYIEFMTTTGDWSDAFFMSRGQFRRMENMKIGPDLHGRATEIYIIFRVYNLGKDNTRAWVYVDPATLREEGKLLFFPES
ncbi:hypothetical protein BDW67DRAFT_179145 [Aspergillus spinulosporus]